ncbi:MAG: ATP-binding cassette domain-containing protein, partial [Methanospirillum sp.]|nr:ATP-binding cassette domain-containing protein [Methanospirillum sp.]
MTALITVQDLTMDFDGTEALKHVSFEIGEGEILGVIGRSGAGKTVLMHLLRGVDEPPTAGTVTYHVSVCGGCGQV